MIVNGWIRREAARLQPGLAGECDCAVLAWWGRFHSSRCPVHRTDLARTASPGEIHATHNAVMSEHLPDYPA